MQPTPVCLTVRKLLQTGRVDIVDMVVYMVECEFIDENREAAWNEWYSGHQRDFLSVDEFVTTQRFIAIGRSFPKYRAMYTLTSAAAFENPVYKGFKGGNFPTEWRSAITSFHRNLFEVKSEAPIVEETSCLVIADEPKSDRIGDVTLNRWPAVGLDMSVAERGIAVVSRAKGEELLNKSFSGVGVYAPLTKQIRKD